MIFQNEAVVIGSANNSKVEPVLKDKFYEFKYIRLWWPMQDYFNLTVSRVDNVFAGDTNLPEGWDLGSKLRLGLWNIWFNRDYTAYGDATNQKFDINQWPVADWMYFYVRKDVASQIWDFGTGGVQVSNLPQDPFNAVRCDACTPSKTFGEPGAAAGQLNHPRALTFGPDGKLYVADSLNGRIEVLDAQGQFVRQIGSTSAGDQGGADGTFREPWGIAVAQDGTIFVTDTWNHRVEVFDKNGNFIRKWGQFEQVAGESGSGLPDGMWGPRAIAISASGQVYLADTGNKRIRVYDRQGNFQYDIGRDPAGIQLNEPVGLAIDNTNNQLYIADTWNKRVEVVTLGPNPRELRSYTLQAWADTTQSSNRPFLALDPSGTRLYVTDPDASRVLVMDALTGKALASFTSSGGPLGGVVVDAEDHLFVADANGSHILRYDTSAIPGAPVPAQIIAPPPAQQVPTEAATSGAF